jgi:hypothetical protein
MPTSNAFTLSPIAEGDALYFEYVTQGGNQRVYISKQTYAKLRASFMRRIADLSPSQSNAHFLNPYTRLPVMIVSKTSGGNKAVIFSKSLFRMALWSVLIKGKEYDLMDAISNQSTDELLDEMYNTFKESKVPHTLTRIVKTIQHIKESQSDVIDELSLNMMESNTSHNSKSKHSSISKRNVNSSRNSVVRI